MPWQGVSPVDLRMRFVTEDLTEHFSMTELAASYGVCRKTAYYWVKHYETEGPGRLTGASRRPHRMPRATPPAIARRLIARRRQHPSWGADKLRDHLTTRDPATAWPCRDTIHTIRVRAGTVRQRRRPWSPLTGIFLADIEPSGRVEAGCTQFLQRFSRK